MTDKNDRWKFVELLAKVTEALAAVAGVIVAYLVFVYSPHPSQADRSSQTAGDTVKVPTVIEQTNPRKMFKTPVVIEHKVDRKENDNDKSPVDSANLLSGSGTVEVTLTQFQNVQDINITCPDCEMIRTIPENVIGNIMIFKYFLTVEDDHDSGQRINLLIYNKSSRQSFSVRVADHELTQIRL